MPKGIYKRKRSQRASMKRSAKHRWKDPMERKKAHLRGEISHWLWVLRYAPEFWSMAETKINIARAELMKLEQEEKA